MATLDAVYLVPLGAALGDSVPVDQLAGVDSEQVRALRALGYEASRVADEDAVDLCHAAIKSKAESVFAEKDVDVLIHCIGAESSDPGDHDLSWLLRTHDLAPSRIFGITPHHCASFLMQIDLSVALVARGAARSTLNLVAGRADGDPPRLRGVEHLQSDGACGFVVTTRLGAGPRYRILAHRVTYEHPADQLPGDRRPDGSRRSTMKAVHLRRLARDALEEAGLRGDQIAHFVVQNLGAARMRGLAELCGVPAEATWLGSLSANGHVIAADSLINLDDASRDGMAEDATVMVIGTSKTAMGVLILRRVAAEPDGMG
ncbi:MAG: hypothetical protein V7603_788 [Micromonosporaceae bacterium]